MFSWEPSPHLVPGLFMVPEPASIWLRRQGEPRSAFGCIGRAFLVGVAGAKWITNEVDKRLLKESVKVAGAKRLTSEKCEELVKGSALQVLKRVEAASRQARADRRCAGRSA